MKKDKPFTFEMSLSVLNHLGRNLYRSFITVLGEAISNAWDADAENVRIYVDRKNNNFVIKDDGDGMSRSDFQNKFLKIGYTKRKDGVCVSKKGRPYIGRKGIGKLALLSCSNKITVISKTINKDYVGGTIDNSGLDKAITKDLTPQQYKLKKYRADIFRKYTRNHDKGTIICFENIKGGIKNSLDFLRKVIALYFRFSLLDKSFNIFINDDLITLDCLDDLAKKTEFLWNINKLDDPYINERLKDLKEPAKQLRTQNNVKGFIASVSKPSNLKIMSTEERAGVDLFVNGRLRERNILKHIPTARLAENYFYGQIHFNTLDDNKDRFATGREGIVANDLKYKRFLKNIRKIVLKILTDWDKLRLKHKLEGDSENTRISRTKRVSLGLYNAVSKGYGPSKGSKSKKKVDGWISDLSDDAAFNFESYAECFISENLIRKYIKDNKTAMTSIAKGEVAKWRKTERDRKRSGNINISIRQGNDDLSYLDMDYLARLVDKAGAQNCLPHDAKQYKPIRGALMHTALLTNTAKRKLTTVYENIRGRIKTLLT